MTPRRSSTPATRFRLPASGTPPPFAGSGQPEAGSRGGWWATAALAFILLVSAAWWAVALWPASEQAPAWLQATRAVCFGVHDSGLPSAGGWILLIGEPLGMLAALVIVWPDATRAALRRLAGSAGGRAALALVAVLLCAGLGAAGWRVATASATPAGAAGAAGGAEAAGRTLNEPAPPLALVDQHGAALTLERFRGRPLLLGFAYGHCETVCPLIVRDLLEAQRRFAPERRPAVVVVTLDPWRDTPRRLAGIAAHWGLGADAYLAGGAVAEVQRVLADWRVGIARDERTGEVAHTPLLYVIDAAGRLRASLPGDAAAIAAAVERL